MRIKTIGQIILCLRTRNNISRESLCEGICSDRTLVRIEKENQRGNKWILETFLGRMGKATTNMEYYLGKKELKVQDMRMQIEAAYQSGKIEVISNLLEEYSHYQEAKKSLHQQFIYKWKSLICNEDEAENRLHYIKEALLCTVPQFYSKEIQCFFLSEEELNIIILIARAYEKYGNSMEAYHLLKKCYEYLQQARIGDEMRLRSLPSLVLFIVEQAKKMNDRITWKEATNKTIALLIKNRRLHTLPEMMMLRAEVMQFEICSVDEQIFYKRELQFASKLKRIQKENENIKGQIINQSSVMLEHSGYLFIGEYIRNRRLALHITQFELTKNESICTIRQLSNIETGKSKPDESLYHKLMNGLGINESFYESFVDSSNFTLDEKRFQLDCYITQRKLSEAQILFQEMKPDFTQSKADLQFTLFLQTMLDVQLNVLSPSIALSNLEQALSYSIGDYKNQDFSEWSLSRNEVKILNSIAIMNAECGNIDHSIHIFYQIKTNYEKDGANVPRHLHLYELILINLTKYLGLRGRHKDAIDTADQGIQICIRSGNINFLPVFLYSKVWNIEKCKDNMQDLCKEYLRQAYLLSFLTDDAEKQGFITSFYQDKYNEMLQFDEM